MRNTKLRLLSSAVLVISVLLCFIGRRLYTISGKVDVYNARSVANKADSIAHRTYTKLAGVVETRHDSHDSPSLISCTLDGYRHAERERDLARMTANHGVCLCCHMSDVSALHLAVRLCYCPSVRTADGC